MVCDDKTFRLEYGYSTGPATAKQCLDRAQEWFKQLETWGAVEFRISVSPVTVITSYDIKKALDEAEKEMKI